MKHLHDCARTAFQEWIADGRCIDSQSYSNMKEKRRIFKKALKECKKRNEQCKADYLATALQNDRSKKQFWSKVKSVGKKKLLPTEIEGNSTPISITEMWRSHYSQLLNSSHSQCHNTAVLGHLCDGAQYKNINNFYCSIKLVPSLLVKLPLNKSVGVDKLSAEHLRVCDPIINVYLSLYYNMCLKHGYIPSNCLDTVIIPTLKNINGIVLLL